MIVPNGWSKQCVWVCIHSTRYVFVHVTEKYWSVNEVKNENQQNTQGMK